MHFPTILPPLSPASQQFVCWVISCDGSYYKATQPNQQVRDGLAVNLPLNDVDVLYPPAEGQGKVGKAGLIFKYFAALVLIKLLSTMTAV